jgi:hypothetical protein
LAFLLLTKFHHKEKIKNSEKKWFLRFSVTKSGKEQKEELKQPDSYIWFLLCSQKYKKMIKDLYFISGL